MHIDNYTVKGRLVLRTCDENMQSYDGKFQWPEQDGIAEALDWKPTKECGNGLHGLLEGNGDASLCNWKDSARWLVVDTLDSEIIDLHGKVKFRRGRVLFAGDRKDAIKVLRRFGVSGPIVGDTIEDEDYKMVTAGNYGSAKAGNYSKATAGDHGIATVGIWGTAIAGNYGIATAGNYGTATTGNYGKATVGDHGTAIAENYGTATAGIGGKAAAGKKGVIIIVYDTTRNHRKCITGYVGKNGIKPNTLYRADNNGKLIPVDGKTSFEEQRNDNN